MKVILRMLKERRRSLKNKSVPFYSVLSGGGEEDGVSGSGGGAICRREHFGSGSGCQFRGSA
jgi:hypothetical protein